MKKILFASFLFLSIAFVSSNSVEATSNEFVVCVNCKAMDNLDMKASSFISKCRKGSIRTEFPTYLLEKDLRYISKQGDADSKKAWKLLTNGRFKK